MNAAKPSSPQPKALRGWKLWCARALAMFGVPLVFFGLVELGLRLGGYGHPSAFLLPRSGTGGQILVQNNRFGWRLFGARMARTPYPMALPQPKAPTAIRIFVFGESAAYGDPQDVWGRQNLALCWQKLGRREEAIREFQQVLALKPRFGMASLGLGQVYEEIGRQAEAAVCYGQALTNRIHRANELATLARFCQSRGWFEAAATNYADAIALSPSDARLRVETGQVLAALGRHEQAAQRYDEALSLAPDQGQTHFLRGVELGRLGRPSEAEPEFRAAVRLLPGLVEARLNLGISLYQQSRLDAALKEFEEVLQRSPTNALALKYTQTLQAQSARAKAN